ncbi:hypothetical protein T265_02078 [Opisthorchis viverrini]|uniref:PH domain-containing protein n=1 Tax=Opisthorchis viverrini TaxID=6198 RepID=A0A075A0E5_OPIVI|nr:hypothetical protein T265_02078 [Opisthorchis viverrini]KER31707.1 hypothetical protein T265_02078 [Opisthorchis viverrini]
MPFSLERNGSQIASVVVKEGLLSLWLPQKSKWQNVYCKLQQSGWFYWFHKSGYRKPIHGVDLKVVAAFFAHGELTKALSVRPAGMIDADYERAFALTKEPVVGSEIFFFLCSNMAEMKSWVTSIFTVLGQPVPAEYQVSTIGIAYQQGNPVCTQGVGIPVSVNAATSFPLLLVRPYSGTSSPTATTQQILPTQRTASPTPTGHNLNPPIQQSSSVPTLFRLIPSSASPLPSATVPAMQQAAFPIMAQPLVLQPVTQIPHPLPNGESKGPFRSLSDAGNIVKEASAQGRPLEKGTPKPHGKSSHSDNQRDFISSPKVTSQQSLFRRIDP